VTTADELLERKNCGSDLENRDYGRMDPTPFRPHKLALTLPTSDGRLVGIVRSRTEATQFCLLEILVVYMFFFLAAM
jgi:hypothetical protein